MRACTQAQELGQGVVSIRARHCWRAMPSAAIRRAAIPAFQSAPAIAGGRCGWPMMAASRAPCFNPRPPLLAGDARLAALQAGDNVGVSIRARHCWRAMPARRAWPGRAPTCFNPRPPLLAGDALHYQRLASPVLFPVLARTSVRPFDWSNRLMRARRKSIERQRLMKRANLFDATPSLQVRDAHDSTAPCPTAPTAHQNPPP